MHTKLYFTAMLLISLLCLVLTTHATPQPDAPRQQIITDTYTEDFTTYTYKAYTDDTIWDIWEGQGRLTRRDAPSQFYPAIASDGSDNLLLVWLDYFNADIYAQKVDSNGNRLWAQDVRINSVSGTAARRSPAIVSDSHGNLMLTWSDYRNGANEPDIYAQKLDSNGNRLWTQDVKVNSGAGTGYQTDPAIASDSNDNLLIVWADDRNVTTSYEIFAQKLDGNGNRLWVQDVKVSSGAVTGYQIAPAIASDNGDNLLMVWQDTRNGNYDIYAQKLDGNGTRLWVQDVLVNSDAGTTEQLSPDIASDNNGNLMLAWMGSRNGTNGADIYAQKLNSDGVRLWAQDVRVNSEISPTGSVHSFAINIDKNENLLLAWADNRNVNYDIYAQKLDGNGTRQWAQDVRINSEIGTASQSSPTIASDSSDNLFLAWMDERNDDYDIYAQKIDTNANRLWAQDVRVSGDSGVAHQYEPSIASDSNGNLLLVWEDTRNGKPHIYAQKLNGNGVPLWVQDVRVSTINGIDQRFNPAITSDSNGNLLAVWMDSRNGNYDIYAQKLDSNGNWLWAQDVRVNSDSGTAHQGEPSITSDSGGNLLLAWTDTRNGNSNGDIYAQKLDGNGNKLWANDIRVNSDLGTSSQYVPAVASDSNGNFLLTWNDARNGNTDIYAQKISSTGNRLWVQDVLVNSDAGITDQRYPAIASDNNGNLMLAWMDFRNGTNGADIYTQKLNNDGVRLWAQDVRVNSASGTAQYGSAIASDNSGNLLLAWTDTRNGTGNEDIYTQKLDVDGNKLWGNDIRANSDPGNGLQSSPAVTSNSDGNLLLVWQDRRNGNSNEDIYTQKLDGNGNKLWAQDLQVIYPDLFYLPAGIIESRTVDTVAADIAYADLDVTAHLNGGTVQYFLTNNGGQDWAEVSPGITHIFTTTGSDLRWRARLVAGNDVSQSPFIDNLNITYGSGFPPPGNLSADETSSTQINLSWTDNSDNEDGFTIERSPDGDGNWTPIETVGADVTNYQDSNLTCGVTYFYRVYAHNTGGNSDYSNTASATTIICVPDTPENLSIVVVATTQVDLSWTDNSDNEDGFTIERSPDSNGDWIPIYTVGTNVTNYQNSNLTCGTTYYYRVYAYNASGDSEYSNTAMVSMLPCLYESDSYEPDDSCAQASFITTDGTIQNHTYHQHADEDWVVFQAEANTVYRIEAQIPPGSPADITLELYDQCAGLPLSEQDYTFTPGVVLEFTAPADGSIYLRWLNGDPTVFGESVAYNLSVNALEPEASPGAVIIVAGRLKANDFLQPNIHYIANQVYQLFQANGYTVDRIAYLATDASLPGYDVPATAADLQAAITSWALSRVDADRPLTLYLVDHGDSDLIYLNKPAGQWVSPTQLDAWLTELEAARPGLKVNVIIEACKSGSFIDLAQTISKDGRVIITSTGSTNDAYAPAPGAIFSDHFVAALQQGQSLYQSFLSAKWATEIAYPHQTPWLDDEGNSLPNQPADGIIAAGRGFAFAGTLADEIWPPYIAEGVAPVEIDQGSGILRANVLDDEQVKRVWAVIYPPSYQPPPDGEELVSEVIPTIDLQNQGNDWYAVSYPGFDETGVYRVVIYAEDYEGWEARPLTVQVRTGWAVYLPFVRK